MCDGDGEVNLAGQNLRNALNTNAGHLIERADPSFIQSDSTDCSTECGQMNLSFILLVQQRRKNERIESGRLFKMLSRCPILV